MRREIKLWGTELIASRMLCKCRWFVADGPLSRHSMPHSAPDSREKLPEIERVILLRGVVWQGKNVNAFKMWQDLMRFWPIPFAPDYNKANTPLYAHAGKPFLPASCHCPCALHLPDAWTKNAFSKSFAVLATAQCLLALILGQRAFLLTDVTLRKSWRGLMSLTVRMARYDQAACQVLKCVPTSQEWLTWLGSCTRRFASLSRRPRLFNGDAISGVTVWEVPWPCCLPCSSGCACPCPPTCSSVAPLALPPSSPMEVDVEELRS